MTGQVRLVEDVSYENTGGRRAPWTEGGLLYSHLALTAVHTERQNRTCVLLH